MTLPRVSVAAVNAGAALDRAGSKDELEAIWVSSGCDNFRHAERRYLMDVYRSVINRIDRQAHQLKLARAI